ESGARPLTPMSIAVEQTDERPGRRDRPDADESATASRTDGVFGSFAAADGLAFASGDADDPEHAGAPVRGDEPPPAVTGGGDGRSGFLSSDGLGPPIDSGTVPQADSAPPPTPTPTPTAAPTPSPVAPVARQASGTIASATNEPPQGPGPAYTRS